MGLLQYNGLYLQKNPILNKHMGLSHKNFELDWVRCNRYSEDMSTIKLAWFVGSIMFMWSQQKEKGGRLGSSSGWANDSFSFYEVKVQYYILF